MWEGIWRPTKRLPRRRGLEYQQPYLKTPDARMKSWGYFRGTRSIGSFNEGESNLPGVCMNEKSPLRQKLDLIYLFKKQIYREGPHHSSIRTLFSLWFRQASNLQK
jgi:hypothetical protein